MRNAILAAVAFVAIGLSAGQADAQVAAASAPYVEQLPGTGTQYDIVLIRFPSPPLSAVNGGQVAATPQDADSICNGLNYGTTSKFYGVDYQGRIAWVICARQR